MKRKLEKEVMDDKRQVYAYAHADFSASNKLLIGKLTRTNLQKQGNILDLGCGPADIPINLVKKNPDIKVTAVDASKEMLKFARNRTRSLGLTKKITLLRGKIPGLKKLLKNKRFGMIISKDLLHHLPQPSLLWEEIKSLSQRGTLIYVMDLLRPHHKEVARKIVETVSADEAEILKIDFYNSLLAAFTIKEIKQQLKTAHLKFDVKKMGTRHFLVKGMM